MARGVVPHDLWDAYWATRGVAERNALTMHYLPLVRAASEKTLRRLPAHVDYEDGRSAGVFGLMDAIEKFDPERKVKFETYAVTRIQGAVLDELRSQDWLPRNVRNRVRTYDQAVQRLEIELQRPPTADEVAVELETSVDQVLATQRDFTRLRALSIDVLSEESGGHEGVGLLDVLQDYSTSPEQHAEVGVLADSLASAVAQMTGKARMVLSLCYVEGMTLSQVGRVLGVTESRVCQLHSGALRDIQHALEGTGG